MPRKEDILAGRVLRRVRERAGVTQEVLGERIGISYQQIQKNETGQNRISVSRLFDYAKALDTEPHVIVRLIEFEAQAEKDF